MSWHDTQTNTRGRILQQFLISKHLHIMNEKSTLTTFHNSRGTSNIDLMVISNQVLTAAEHWEVSDQESCSDLSKSYFSQQSAVLSFNNVSIQRSHQRVPARILLQARILEHPIKFPTEHSIHERF